MTWPLILLIVAVVATVTLWGIFAYIAVRGLRTEIPDARFGPLLSVQEIDEPAGMKILLPIDGSAASIAAVQEVAHCPLPPGSTIELLYAIHSRLPVIPDFPPWAVTIAATHGESIREQTRRAPDVLEAATRHLRAHQPHVSIVTKTAEGVPEDLILREAAAWSADRIVLGSHGRGRAGRTILGSTAAAVAARAPCTVQIARSRPAAARRVAGANVA
jgi:nucleotide-binding universal stress UspA family protein